VNGGQWHVNVTPEAADDLRRLRHTRRKVWRDADGLLDQLTVDPTVLGDGMDPPFVSCRRCHFWNDKYRLVWRIVADEKRVDVLGCDLKTPTFYNRMAERLVGLLQL
jgi:mRNA-degrading endonuclease RelE of RelBE toxin-antitoxin system